MAVSRYTILKIDALELIRAANRDAYLTSAPRKNRYLLDLSDPLMLYSSVIVSQLELPDNALFHQILEEEKENVSLKGLQFNLRSEEILQKSIVIVDYSGVFNTMHSLESAEEAIESIKTTPEPFSTEDHLMHLLNPHMQGLLSEAEVLQIRFSENELYSFLPFDKSSSMSKDCQITYLNSALRAPLETRLSMGINFKKQKLQLSKYYSYRGLYLSAGLGVPTNRLAFRLNQNTVIVIPDLMLSPKGNFVKADNEKKALPLLLVSENVPEEGQRHEFHEIRSEGQKINAFDGEGFISPSYAEYLAGVLGYDPSDNRQPRSFQIRMPFIKGMLHTADYISFLQKESPDDLEPAILDCFGIKRNLNQAKIILTASMFKCLKWLQAEWKNQNKVASEESDPMKYYFEQFAKYHHQLYVCSTDAPLRPDGFENLNYQFLDTLALTSGEFKTLIDHHFENSWDCLQTTYHPDPRLPLENKLIAAAVKNYGFYNDDALKKQATDSCIKMRLECGQGLLKAHGEHRFLSSDLLALLFYLKDLTAARKNNESLSENYCFDGYKNRLLNERFYMPESALNLSKKKYYAILRNPHLSRNEEMILRPHIPSGETDDYQTYFGNLRGVLMFPVNSFYPMVISGADYDGDFVKIYSDEEITNAIRRGVYDENYRRKLPVVIIPNEDSFSTTPNDFDFIFLIINTFSNFTGLLSNLAVRFAENEYGSGNDLPSGNLCAISCAVTGLEIDSSKHGHHPIDDIKYLQQKAEGKGNDSRTFIDIKNYLEKLKSFYIITPKKKGAYQLTQGKGSSGQTINRPSENNPNLLLLPYAFAKHSADINDIYSDQKALYDHGVLPSTNSFDEPKLFHFESEKEPYGASGLTDEGIKSTLELIDAWKRINNAVKDYKRNLRDLKTIPAYSHLYRLLQAKYDSLNEGVPLPGDSRSRQTISKTLELFIAFVTTTLSNNRLSKDWEALCNNWIFTPREKRSEVLKKILAVDHSAVCPISPEAEALICDFSCRGYLVLEYVLSIARTRITNEKKLKQFVKKHTNTTDKNKYYNILTEYLFHGYHNDCASAWNEESIDDPADTDSFDFSEEHVRPSFAVTARGINNECYRQLLSYIIPENKVNMNEKDEDLVLKYVWAATYNNQEKDTAFFWEVLPKDVILNGIRKEKF